MQFEPNAQGGVRPVSPADAPARLQQLVATLSAAAPGVTVLVVMMQETEGLALITGGIARVSTPRTIEAVVAFGTGLVSVYSSTSGVVLPAFLPIVPDLAQRLGGIDPLSIAWSMNVSASLVDLSSLSTVGALYIAGAAPGSDVRALFNGLLVWGLSMAVVGAALCWILFT